MHVRITFVGLVTGLIALASAAGAGAKSLTAPVKLTGPAGGEPSIATDPLGDVFVASPQGIPSGANGTAGTGFWVSHNDGTTFGKGTLIGSYLGGGDDDVIVSKGTVYTADLEAAATEVCKSSDRGATFTGIGTFPDPTQCSGLN